MTCTVCHKTEVDRAHVRTRGAGAGWQEWEWIPLCRFHHIEQGRRGWWTFIKRHPMVMTALTERGWRWIESVGKMILWNDKAEIEKADSCL